ncbi:unnamed protein product [Rotaria socialis]|uniref:LITAF domain-containing protein n=1 Tax=Rotaria socialis TaxID=392032 RepID=A0A817SSQ4_9BILA|nr:unnamed protein product [Rotaria socialis]CAF3334755.1 unnamed protein product [Rotaria socialis]CAF3431670.1 unnamed protein product [Rotaria socialis]CAF3755823.1 unnamed protein product [Rotaria socialis]CAF4204686.1 unnamed protein product [Rotaria socialis]
MNNDPQEPPPPYMEVENKNVPMVGGHPYSLPQQGPTGDIRYVTGNPPMGTYYTVQAVPIGIFSRNPVQCTCSHCGSIIVTRIEETSGLLAWLICALLVIFGCWLGCCLIPFCVSDFQNIKHYCPNCKAFLAEYRPL